MILDLSYDLPSVEAFTDGHVAKALQISLSKSGGDAIRTMRVASSRVVRFRKRLKVRKVNRSMVLAFPRKGTKIDGLVWTMRVEGSAVPLVEFPHRKTAGKTFGRKGRQFFRPGGVSVAVNSGGFKLVEGAFLATMKNGHKGIFWRSGARRLPIRELYSTKVTDVLGDSGMIEAVHGRASDTFGKSFDRLFPIELGKLRRR